jgi:predicted anti-sigma-YlaC factor YlaD
MGQISLHTCDDIRELCSASVDGELSEFDAMRVQAHLAGCAACSAFADTARQTSRLVSDTPLEDLHVPIVMPSRRLALARKLQVASAAAAVAVAVGVGAAVGTIGAPTGSTSERPAKTQPAAAKLRFPDEELRLLERTSRPRSHTQLAL